MDREWMDGPSSHDSVIVFAAGQRILRYCSDVLETVVLVNPSEETAVSEVNRISLTIFKHHHHL